MAEIKRKDAAGKFEASEPDFGGLKSGVGSSASGFDSGVGAQRSQAAPAQTLPETQSPEPVKGGLEAPTEEPKKRYYSPGEVMKKKGCIGCGGMVLAAAVPLILAVVALVSTLL